MSRRSVRRAFDRAAGSYNAAARLQRRVCELLLAELADSRPESVLDAGCGTGYAIELLSRRWPLAHIVATDFAPAMVAAAGGGICADIEALPFASCAFDLYWSSLALQWCDVRRAMGEAARVLAPGGRLVVSTLAHGTLAELGAAFAGSDGYRHVLQFEPPEALATACSTAGLVDIRYQRHTLRFHHDSLAALLRELKALGANEVGANRRPGLMGRRTWQTMQDRYEARRENAGLPATFEVILCRAKKPTS